MAAEEVAQLLGHSPTGTFEMVYRHVLKPRRRDGQAVLTLSLFHPDLGVARHTA
jgi:integrase